MVSKGSLGGVLLIFAAINASSLKGQSAQTPQQLIDSPTCSNANCHGGARTAAVSSVANARRRVLSTTNPMPPSGATPAIRAVFENAATGASSATGSTTGSSGFNSGFDDSTIDNSDDSSDSLTGSGFGTGDTDTSDTTAGTAGSDSGFGDQGGIFGADTQASGFGDDTPLVLDLNGDGHVVPKKRRVHFDLAATGRSSVLEWPGPEDGLLAIDLNGNGVIDSGRELFGNRSAGLAHRVDDGFQALAFYDTDANMRIDPRDAVFERLLVWRDANSDGRTNRFELLTISELGIVELSLSVEPDPHPRIVKRSVYNKDGRRFILADVLLRVHYGARLVEK